MLEGLTRLTCLRIRFESLIACSYLMMSKSILLSMVHAMLYGALATMDSF